MTADLFQYRPEPGRLDEAVDPSGAFRPAWELIARTLAVAGGPNLADRQRQAERLLDAEGAGHLVHDLALERRDGGHHDSRPWRLDPIPFVLDGAEFTELARGVVQRMTFLELLLEDLYGARSLVRAATVPGSMLHARPGYRLGAVGAPVPKRLVTYAVDVVRTVDGAWRVVQDLTDAPSALGYALLDRAVLARLMPEQLRTYGVAPIGQHVARVRLALAAQAPSGRRSPRTVVLTGGPTNTTYVEHSYLALQFGFHLVEGADLLVREQRVWLRSLDGLEPVDVVYRRLDDGQLDPLEVGAAGADGVPAIALAARRSGVALANAYGCGVADDQELWPYHDAAASALLGESLRLTQLRGGIGGCATAPVFTGDGSGTVAPGHVVVRMHAVAGPDGISVMPGGSGRVLARGDDPRRPTSRLVKDVWVVGLAPAQLAPTRRGEIPQVDLAASVPTRAADSLYLMGRGAERAEASVRASRVVASQLSQDPGLVVASDGAWASGVIALLRSAKAGLTLDTSASAPLAERIARELDDTNMSAAAHVASLVQDATSVREFLSNTTGRVLGRLAHLRVSLVDGTASADDLDTMLVDLAALAGLAMESTVRGPAWRFHDLGRRLERALFVLGSVQATLGLALDAVGFQPLAEALLAANESLVAYRRRRRSDVELGAVIDLVVRDDSNPRSVAFQLDRLREHMAALAWHEGAELVQEASLASLALLDDVVAGGRRLSVDGLVLATRAPLLELDRAVVERWFAAPVRPTAIGAW